MSIPKLDRYAEIARLFKDVVLPIDPLEERPPSAPGLYSVFTGRGLMDPALAEHPEASLLEPATRFAVGTLARFRRDMLERRLYIPPGVTRASRLLTYTRGDVPKGLRRRFFPAVCGTLDVPGAHCGFLFRGSCLDDLVVEAYRLNPMDTFGNDSESAAQDPSPEPVLTVPVGQLFDYLIERGSRDTMWCRLVRLQGSLDSHVQLGRAVTQFVRIKSEAVWATDRWGKPNRLLRLLGLELMGPVASLLRFEDKDNPDADPMYEEYVNACFKAGLRLCRRNGHLELAKLARRTRVALKASRGVEWSFCTDRPITTLRTGGNMFDVWVPPTVAMKDILWIVARLLGATNALSAARWGHDEPEYYKYKPRPAETEEGEPAAE